ncbi:MAG: tripartite tricarboxylate transporter TctB family protein [Beijerinckiaceae bacterium]|nr:tripartite tricarboxylate transporter TctB family protein [Beijerinckiaceae bacterium]
MIRIRSPQDFGAALIFLAVGAAGLWFGAGLPGMRAGGQLGSGTTPRILSVICLGFGGLMLLRALRVDGPAIERLPWRALITVTLAVVLFGLAIEHIGYVATAMLTPFVAALALPPVRWREALLVAGLLGGGTALLFVVMLGQPLKLFGGTP